MLHLRKLFYHFRKSKFCIHKLQCQISYKGHQLIFKNRIFYLIIIITLEIIYFMSEPLQQCQNCLKDFPQSKIATHFGYCRRNIKKCEQCGEMYDKNYQEEHQEEFHKKAACQFCKKQFGVAELDKHKLNCNLRTKFCQYCQLNVPINEYPTHLKACQSRTKMCDKCRKPIFNKEYLVHLTTCVGVVQQPNSYQQYQKKIKQRQQREKYLRQKQLEKQKERQRQRDQYRQQYTKAQIKSQEKKQIDFKKREVPSNNINVPTSHYALPSKSPQPYSYSNNAGSISSNNRIPPNSNIGIRPQEPHIYPPKQHVAFRSGISNPRTNINEEKAQPKNEIRPSYKAEQKPQSKNEPRYDVRNQNRYQYKYQSKNLMPGKLENKKSEQYSNNYSNKNIQYGKKQSSTNKYGNIQPTTILSNKVEQKMPLNNNNVIKKQPSRQQRRQQKVFDPSEYGGYSDDIPAHLLGQQEDLELQRIIYETAISNKVNRKQLPIQMSEDLMNSSVCMDFDIERQRIQYEEAQKNARKKR